MDQVQFGELRTQLLQRRVELVRVEIPSPDIKFLSRVQSDLSLASVDQTLSDYLQLVEASQVTEHGLVVVEHEEHRLDVWTDLAHHRQLLTGVEEILL